MGNESMIFQIKIDRTSEYYKELKAKVQELHNEVNCMNDSREFKDAESVRSGHKSHVPSEPALFPLPEYPGGQPDIWNAHGFPGSVFANPLHILGHLVQECSTHGMSQLREVFGCKQARVNLQLKVVIEITTRFQLRDFYEVRQPGGEKFQKLWDRPTTTSNLGTSP